MPARLSASNPDRPAPSLKSIVVVTAATDSDRIARLIHDIGLAQAEAAPSPPANMSPPSAYNLDDHSIQAWTRFALTKRGIGMATALVDTPATMPDDLMFMSGETIIVLYHEPGPADTDADKDKGKDKDKVNGNGKGKDRAADTDDGWYLGYCEGVVGRFKGSHVRFHAKLKRPSIQPRRSTTSVHTINAIPRPGSSSSGAHSPRASTGAYSPRASTTRTADTLTQLLGTAATLDIAPAPAHADAAVLLTESPSRLSEAIDVPNGPPLSERSASGSELVGDDWKDDGFEIVQGHPDDSSFDPPVSSRPTSFVPVPPLRLNKSPRHLPEHMGNLHLDDDRGHWPPTSSSNLSSRRATPSPSLSSRRATPSPSRPGSRDRHVGSAVSHSDGESALTSVPPSPATATSETFLSATQSPILPKIHTQQLDPAARLPRSNASSPLHARYHQAHATLSPPSRRSPLPSLASREASPTPLSASSRSVSPAVAPAPAPAPPVSAAQALLTSRSTPQSTAAPHLSPSPSSQGSRTASPAFSGSSTDSEADGPFGLGLDLGLTTPPLSDETVSKTVLTSSKVGAGAGAGVGTGAGVGAARDGDQQPSALTYLSGGDPADDRTATVDSLSSAVSPKFDDNDDDNDNDNDRVSIVLPPSPHSSSEEATIEGSAYARASSKPITTTTAPRPAPVRVASPEEDRDMLRADPQARHRPAVGRARSASSNSISTVSSSNSYTNIAVGARHQHQSQNQNQRFRRSVVGDDIEESSAYDTEDAFSLLDNYKYGGSTDELSMMSSVSVDTLAGSSPRSTLYGSADDLSRIGASADGPRPFSELAATASKREQQHQQRGASSGLAERRSKRYSAFPSPAAVVNALSPTKSTPSDPLPPVPPPVPPLASSSSSSSSSSSAKREEDDKTPPSEGSTPRSSKRHSAFIPALSATAVAALAAGEMLPPVPPSPNKVKVSLEGRKSPPKSIQAVASSSSSSSNTPLGTPPNAFTPKGRVVDAGASSEDSSGASSPSSSSRFHHHPDRGMAEFKFPRPPVDPSATTTTTKKGERESTFAVSVQDDSQPSPPVQPERKADHTDASPTSTVGPGSDAHHPSHADTATPLSAPSGGKEDGDASEGAAAAAPSFPRPPPSSVPSPQRAPPQQSSSPERAHRPSSPRTAAATATTAVPQTPPVRAGPQNQPSVQLQKQAPSPSSSPPPSSSSSPSSGRGGRPAGSTSMAPIRNQLLHGPSPAGAGADEPAQKVVEPRYPSSAQQATAVEAHYSAQRTMAGIGAGGGLQGLQTIRPRMQVDLLSSSKPVPIEWIIGGRDDDQQQPYSTTGYARARNPAAGAAKHAASPLQAGPRPNFVARPRPRSQSLSTLDMPMPLESKLAFTEEWPPIVGDDVRPLPPRASPPRRDSNGSGSGSSSTARQAGPPRGRSVPRQVHKMPSMPSGLRNVTMPPPSQTDEEERPSVSRASERAAQSSTSTSTSNSKKSGFFGALKGGGGGGGGGGEQRHSMPSNNNNNNNNNNAVAVAAAAATGTRGTSPAPAIGERRNSETSTRGSFVRPRREDGSGNGNGNGADATARRSNDKGGSAPPQPKLKTHEELGAKEVSKLDSPLVLQEPSFAAPAAAAPSAPQPRTSMSSAIVNANAGPQQKLAMPPPSSSKDYEGFDLVPANGAGETAAAQGVGAGEGEGEEYDEFGFLDTPSSRRRLPASGPLSKEEAAEVRAKEAQWLKVLATDGESAKKSRKVKQLVRSGVPHSVRGRVWMFLSEAKPVGGQFDALTRRRTKQDVAAAIDKDVDRCYPDNKLFRGPNSAGRQDLSTILRAFSHHEPKVGYTQGLGLIVGCLLLQSPVEDAFWTLAALVDHYLGGYFTPNMKQVQIDGLVMGQMLESVDAKLAKKMADNNVEALMYSTSWFLPLFTRTLPWPTVLRVWDVLFYEGRTFVLRVGLALLKLARDHLLDNEACPGQSEMLHFLLHLPPELLSPDKVLSMAFSIKVKDNDLVKHHRRASISLRERNAATKFANSSRITPMVSAPAKSNNNGQAGRGGTRSASNPSSPLKRPSPIATPGNGQHMPLPSPSSRSANSASPLPSPGFQPPGAPSAGRPGAGGFRGRTMSQPAKPPTGLGKITKARSKSKSRTRS